TGKARAHHHLCTRWQAVELARRRDRPLPQQTLQKRDVAMPSLGIVARLARQRPARFERTDLLLQFEREIERQQVELRALGVATLVRRERGKVVSDGDDRDG